MNRMIISQENSKKSAYFKWTYGLFGNGYRVATLSKLYLIVIGNEMFEIDMTILTYLT